MGNTYYNSMNSAKSAKIRIIDAMNDEVTK